MNFPSSVIALIVAIGINVAEGCPFASSAGSSKYLPKDHPFVPKFHRRAAEEGEESLWGTNGRLVGSPSLKNGAFDAPSMLTPIAEDGSTIADVVAAMSTSGENGDMCLIRFQQLPPPEEGNFSFDQNATDRLALKVYGDMMVERFNQLSGSDVNEGGIILAVTTIGYGGVESMCKAGIEPERFCDDRLLKTSVRWPQAITGYKLTNKTVDAIKAAIGTWRTTDDGHLPSMLWSFNGGQPDIGGSQVGYWGNAGGLFSKIVRCDDIPEKFMYYQYPNNTATGDFIDPETNQTLSEMVYQWWTDYGGYNDKGEQVFGESPSDSLPEECAACVDAIPCFDDTGCSLLDFESQTWNAPYNDCTPAFACLPCFPECKDPTEAPPAECAACVEAVPCFDDTGCSFLDFESQTWSAPYDECTPAFACLPCFPECKDPTEAPPAECAACVEAVPCFDDTGCSFLDFESQTWSAPYDECTPAFACLPCFPECKAPATEAPATPTMAPATPTTAPVASTTAPVTATSAPADSGAAAMSVTTAVVMMMMAGFLF